MDQEPDQLIAEETEPAIRQPPEIDYRTLRLIMGLIALFLATVTSFLANFDLDSISESYHKGGAARDVFVGSLFAISAFLMAYNGHTPRQRILSRVAAVASLGTALFPCACGVLCGVIPFLHYASAGVMFVILAIFCYIFWRCAERKVGTYPEARYRVWIYRACFLTIVVSILAIPLNWKGWISDQFESFVFVAEAVALIAFGIAWLCASRTLPGITNPEERWSLFGSREASET